MGDYCISHPYPDECIAKIRSLDKKYAVRGNEEQYLEQCLESALNQTMQEIEIICINDGSTDGSLQILETMAQKDRRIRVVDKPNSGYGNTMNIGIDLAVGKYLIFLEIGFLFFP